MVSERGQTGCDEECDEECDGLRLVSGLEEQAALACWRNYRKSKHWAHTFHRTPSAHHSIESEIAALY